MMPTSPLAPVLQRLRRAARGPEPAGLTDARLLDLFLGERDEAAFEALVVRHGPMVLGVCRRVLRDPHEAEDAFQATFLVLAKKAASVSPREMVGNWLHGVAHRTALKAKALAARRFAKERQVRDVPRPEPIDQDALDDLRARLDRELGRLPAKYRAAVVLCDLEGTPRREAAAQLGLAEGTLSSRLCRGRQLLARRLAGRGQGVVPAALAEACAPAPVPAPLLVSTVKAATLVAGGQAVTAAVTAKVAALTEGVLQAMSLTKLKYVLALVLVVVVLSAGTVAGPAVATLVPPWPRPGHALATLDPPVEPEVFSSREDEQKPDKQEKPKPAQKEKKPDPSRRVKAEEVVTKTFKTRKAPRLVVETFNGHIAVKAGTSGAAKAKVLKTVHAATKEAAEEDLNNVEVQLEQKGDTIRVTAKPKDEQPQTSRAAAVEVEVPPGSSLDLSSSNGQVTVAGAMGDVAATTSNGRMEVKGSKGALKLKTNNGPIDVKADKAKVSAHTSNGAVRFAGSLADGDHSFQTSNGAVSLTLPADSRFRLDAQTSNGKVACQFPHKRPEGKDRSRLKVSVGDNPAVNLKLRTSNGGIEVRPDQPGKE
jgi:RNA polymerase sigma factor (sigma-70 family)